MMRKGKKEKINSDLLNKGRDIANSMTLQVLHNKTNLPISWLRKFRTGEIESPCVQRVERVITWAGEETITVSKDA